MYLEKLEQEHIDAVGELKESFISKGFTVYHDSGWKVGLERTINKQFLLDSDIDKIDVYVYFSGGAEIKIDIGYPPLYIGCGNGSWHQIKQDVLMKYEMTEDGLEQRYVENRCSSKMYISLDNKQIP